MYLGGRQLRMAVARLDRDRPVFLLIALTLVGGALASALIGQEPRFSILVYPRVAVLLATVLGGLWFLLYALYVMLVVRPAYPIRHVTRHIVGALRAVGVLRLMVLVVAFTFFLSAISSLKSLIPAFNPYHWDPFLAQLDASLYGGIEPWRWLQPLLGHPAVTRAINIAYNLWFFIMLGVLFWQLVDVRRPRRREQFLVMFILIWIVNGTLLATLLSSVGPCFYGRLLPGEADPYAALMAYLHQANAQTAIWAVSTQDDLWALYQGSTLGIGSGISAMPSMHVSMAWLLFLFARRVHRIAGWLMLGYALIILVGSVHLGWHYSVDGYVSIITTTLLWFAVGAWSRRWRCRKVLTGSPSLQSA